MPPPKSGKALTAGPDRDAPPLDRPGGASGRRTGRSSRRSGPPLPAVERPGWVRNPIDALRPRPARARGARARRPRPTATTLIRRVTLDLTGLPPTPAEVDAFLADTSPGRLRAGGRSAAGLAALRRADGDRTGSTPPATPTPTATRPTASAIMWRWRDWVIDAFNRNMPFDQFTIEQLAGDLLPGADARPADRHRLQPQPSRQRRGRDHPRGVRRRVRRRPRRDDRDRLARPDARLRPLPRPQVRPDHAEGVLPALRLLQQRPRERPGGQVRQLAAA